MKIKTLSAILILALSLGAAVPGFRASWLFVQEEYRKVNPEYLSWLKAREEIRGAMIKSREDILTQEDPSGDEDRYEAALQEPGGDRETLKEDPGEEPPHFRYPSFWLKAAGGLAGAFISFFIVFLILWGGTRLLAGAGRFRKKG
jgi:hypothetical protein